MFGTLPALRANRHPTQLRYVGTSRFSSSARVAKSQDDTFELGSRASSMDRTSSDNSSAVDGLFFRQVAYIVQVLNPHSIDVLGPSESLFPRTTFAGFLPPTEEPAPPPIDAPENKSKFTGTVTSASKRSLSFASLFMRPRKPRQSSTSSLSSVDSTGYQL